MLERLKWPGAAAALAVLGAAIRRWQLGSAFDSEGLAQPGAPASWAMIAFYILAGAVLLCLARSTPAAKKPEKRLTAWDTAFAAENDSVYLTLMVAAALLAKIYPVGSLYLSTVNVSPASFLGGEWVPWGTGRTPVGVDAAQTEFASPEQVGGAKSVVLTGENLPTDAVYDGTVTLFASGNYAGGWDFALRGEGKPVPVLQPYITCYMFKRTA